MTNELTLRDNIFEPTATGLVVHGMPTYDEWEYYGRKLEFVEGAIQFLIGDWLNYGERKWGEMYAQAVDETQVKTWTHYKWVSNRVELCTRVHNLSWSHHRLVAPLEPEEQKAWLVEAHTNRWDVTELRRQIQLSTKVLPPKLDGKYRIIYADPPWQYSDALIVDGYKVSAELHYPTMSLVELMELPVYNLAENDAVLFLWATAPMIREAIELASEWGFEYKAQFVWDKVRHNWGHYNSVRHELLLLCTRGSCLPDTKELIDSVQVVERNDHSSKPEEFRIIIDKLYPHGKRIELFARHKVEGWDAWGNETETNR